MPSRQEDEAAFADLLAHLPAPAAAAVRDAMAEPWRRYHAAWHLGRLWRLHRAHGPRDWDDDLALAIAYHDIIYRPDATRRANEYESAAAFLTAAAGMDVAPVRAARIAGWIVASADHLGAGDGLDPAGTWFLDLDLEPLAAEDFDANTALIRAEYAHLPDGVFTAGRRAFLTATLAAPRLFRTATAAHLGWDAMARRNIATDLARAN